MRADVKTATAGMSVPEFKEAFPIGAAQRVILVDDAGKYAGLVIVPEVYAGLVDREEGGDRITDFARFQNDVLQPHMNARQAAMMFDKTQSEALAVVNDLV